MALKLKRGTQIVFEGLDSTGKTLQAEKLAECYPELQRLHMPSGDANSWTQDVYNMMEDRTKQIDPAARQFLHLACHMQARQHIEDRWANAQSTLLDRFWWSTVAYGHQNGEYIARNISLWHWYSICQQLWSFYVPDVVFLFEKPYTDDGWNREEVRKNYGHASRWYEADSSAVAVYRVPQGTPDEVHSLILGVLKSKQLIAEA